MELIELTLVRSGKSYWINPKMLSGILENENGSTSVYMAGESDDDYTVVDESVYEILKKLREIT